MLTTPASACRRALLALMLVFGATAGALTSAHAAAAAPAVTAAPGATGTGGTTVPVTWGVDNAKGELGDPGRNSTEVGAVMGLDGVTVVSISSGFDNTYAVTSTGTVYSWGDNEDNALGTGTTASQDATPSLMSFPQGTFVTGVRCSSFESCLATTRGGALYQWGSPIFSQSQATTPAVVTGLPTTIVAAAVGLSCAYAVTSTGTVYAWGDGLNHCLGTGVDNREAPAVVTFPSNVQISDVAAGDVDGEALTTDGHVYSWGFNQDGEAANGTTSPQETPDATSLSGVSMISAGGTDDMALTSAGAVYTWGAIDGETGQTAPLKTTFTAPVPVITEINASFLSSFAMTASGIAYSWSHATATATPLNIAAVAYVHLGHGGALAYAGLAIPDTITVSAPSTAVAGVNITGETATLHNPIDGSVNTYYFASNWSATVSDPAGTIQSRRVGNNPTVYTFDLPDQNIDRTAGPVTLTFSVNSLPVSGSAVTQVLPGPVKRLTISPAGTVVTAGSSQAFTSEGYDAYGNDAGDQTAATTYSVTGGSCASNSCTSTTAGPQTVTASDNGTAATAGVTVVHAALDHITLAAATFAHAGQIVPVTVSGFDRFGNSAGDVTTGSHLSITPDGSCAAKTCTPKSRGPHTITATEATPGGTMGSATATTTIAIGYATPGITHATLSVGDSQATVTYAIDPHNLSPNTVTVTAVAAGHPTVTVRGNKTSGTLTLLHLLDGVHYTFGVSATGPSDAGTTTATLGIGTPARVPAVSLVLSHSTVHSGALVVLTGRLTLGREGIANHAITLTAQAPHHRVVVLARGHTDGHGFFRFTVHPHVTQSYTVTATFGPRNRLTISRNKPTSVHVA